MKRYSYAGPSRGGSNPEDIRIIRVNAKENCPNPRCERSEPHTIIMWSGNEYSKNHTWISAPETNTINLEDAR